MNTLINHAIGISAFCLFVVFLAGVSKTSRRTSSGPAPGERCLCCGHIKGRKHGNHG